MKTTYVKRLPIPKHAALEEIEHGVSRVLAAKSANPTVDTSAWDREIDEIVYRLYGLTPAEIAIVEGREAGGKKAASAKKVGQAFLPAQDAQTGTSAPPLKKKARKSVLTEDPELA